MKAQQQIQPDEATKKEDERARIAKAAYYRAERRGFAPGNDLDDWLAAEAEINAAARARTNKAQPAKIPESAWTRKN
jgi:hypothetical protein